MQLVASLCLLLVAAAWGAPAETYSDKYDGIDVDTLLKNDRVVTQYVNCLLDKGPCTPEGRDFRQHLPEALATQCGKCTNAQKNIIRKGSKHIIAKRPADWTAIKNKYDPKGQHHNTFMTFLSSN